MGLKIVLIFAYVLITIALFATFDATLPVWLSFFVNALILLFITIFHVFAEKDYSPYVSSFIVFSFLFFLAAPIVQINSFEGINPEFMTKYPYRGSEAVFTNFLISIFNVTFFLSYLLFKKYKPLKKIPTVSQKDIRVLPLTILCILGLCLFVFFISYDFVQDEINRPNWRKSDFSNMVLLTYKKVLFLVPFGGILLCIQYFKKKRKKAINLVTIIVVFLIFLIFLFWFKNPLTEKRNALGPIYICLLFLMAPKLLNTNTKTLFFLFFTMIIGFPLSAIITHSDATFDAIFKDPGILLEEMKGGGITNAFNTLNYDAFTNVMTSVDYVSVHGLSLGNQLLSALFFFVPRSLWENKPYSTGTVVGEYLIDDYGYNFSNLSNPLVSEGYINFGFLGVIIGAVLLAFVIIKLMTWFKSADYLKKMMSFYFALHMLFLLRGDFTNGFSYYVGTLIGVIVIPKGIQFLIQQFLIHQKNGKNQKLH